MTKSLKTTKYNGLIERIQSLLEESFYDEQESEELRNLRELLDWEENYFLVYISHDGIDGVIQHDSIWELKETYEGDYSPSISEVEWSVEPAESDHEYADASDWYIEICNIVPRK